MHASKEFGEPETLLNKNGSTLHQLVQQTGKQEAAKLLEIAKQVIWIDIHTCMKDVHILNCAYTNFLFFYLLGFDKKTEQFG